MTIETTSILTCPACGYSSTETMPTNACVYFHECRGCGIVLKPKSGDCCVFCSYGSLSCPPIRETKRAEGADRHTSGARIP